MRRPLATAALIALAAAARAEEPRKLRLALDRLRVTAGVERAYADAVEQRVCAALVERARDADVVCPADVEAATALAKSAMVFGECPPDECLKRAEALRQADARVTGTLERKDGGAVLTLRLVRGDRAAAEATGKLPGDLDRIAERLPELVKKLLP